MQSLSKAQVAGPLNLAIVTANQYSYQLMPLLQPHFHSHSVNYLINL